MSELVRLGEALQISLKDILDDLLRQLARGIVRVWPIRREQRAVGDREIGGDDCRGIFGKCHSSSFRAGSSARTMTEAGPFDKLRTSGSASPAEACA